MSHAIILGIVQGITEFFPISSSGHLVIFQSLFGMKEPQLAFDIFLHLGTLLSVCIFFWKDIVSLFGKERKLFYYIVLASIPTFIIGFLFKDLAEKYFGMPRAVGYMLLVTGVWLMAATAASFVRKGKSGRPVGPLNALIIGVAQGIAVMPGISRSGATIGTGILAGLEGEKAVRFSFLLSIPAILGASLFKMRDIGAGLVAGDPFYFAAGGLAAMLAGLFAIKVVLHLVKINRLYVFGIYCFLAGFLIIILVK